MTEPPIYQAIATRRLAGVCDSTKPLFVCQGVSCHDRECKNASRDCALALATNMVRAGWPDGALVTPCRYFHTFQSIYCMEEWQRSPKVWSPKDVKIMRDWIRDCGDKGMRVAYMATRRRWNTRYQRDHYVSLTDDAARFTFLMLWRGHAHTPRIDWPVDWQLRD